MSDTRSVSSAASRRVILESADIDRALTRIAHEILEANRGAQNLVILGIPRRGYPLAQRLAQKSLILMHPSARQCRWVSSI